MKIKISLLLTALSITIFPNLLKAQTNDGPVITPVVNETLSQPDLENHTITGFLMILKPGFSNEANHRHSGDMFGYVIEGAIGMTMEDGKPKVYKAGEMFRERHHQLHSAYKNPSEVDTAKVLMIQIKKKDEQGYIPEQ